MSINDDHLERLVQIGQNQTGERRGFTGDGRPMSVVIFVLRFSYSLWMLVCLSIVYTIEHFQTIV